MRKGGFVISPDPWENGGEGWKSEHPFISFVVGNNYKLLKPRRIDCIWVKRIDGLIPVLDLETGQCKKKFHRCKFLGMSSECDWLPERLLCHDKDAKECNLAIFVGRPKGEEDLFMFFAISAEDDNTHPLFEDDFDL